MIKLVCPECRHENESERIYCHECGARLDRSALAKEVPKEEDPAVTHRRVKAMFDARGAKLRQRFFHMSKLVLGALVLAAIIQMIRPADVPSAQEAQTLPRQISLELENAAMNPHGAPLRYTASELNAYLAYTLKSKQTALGKFLRFERAVMDLQEAYCGLTVERSLMGYSFFSTGSYSLNLQNGVIATASRGGRIGRFPVHPALMKYAGPFLFGDVVKALDRDRKSVTKLGAIELHPETVIFTPKQQP
jgi:hypothetical protein